MMEGCAACSSTQCVACKEGYYLDSFKFGICNRCDANMRHCTSCTGPGNCTSCLENVSELSNGMCRCRKETGWIDVSPTRNCTCQNAYVLSDKNMCLYCEQLVPGCQRCDETSSYIYGQVHIGITPLNKQKEYLTCEDCGRGKYLSLENKICMNCTHISDGCLECDKYGSSCVNCDSGYYLKRRDQQVALECIDCSITFPNCKQCSNEKTCEMCAPGHILKSDGTCSI